MDDGNHAYTTLRQAPRQNLSQIIPLATPFTIYLELTNTCNFKCTFCPMHFEDYGEISGENHSLRENDIIKIYREIVELGHLKTLNFYMLGEPFVNREIARFIGMAKRMNLADRLIVTTNGTLINETAATAIVESGLDFLRFSIYGTTPEELAAVTGSKIQLDRIVKNMRTLRDVRTRTGAKTPFIYAKMIETGDAARNARFRDMFEPIADEVEIEPAMNWNEDVEQVDLSGLGREVLQSAYLMNRKSVCPFPFYTLVINADMQVTVCCVDWKKATAIGNLREESLKDIWNGAKMHDLRIKHLSGRRREIAACQSCTYLHTAPDNIDSLSVDEYLSRLR